MPPVHLAPVPEGGGAGDVSAASPESPTSAPENQWAAHEARFAFIEGSTETAFERLRQCEEKLALVLDRLNHIDYRLDERAGMTGWAGSTSAANFAGDNVSVASRTRPPFGMISDNASVTSRPRHRLADAMTGDNASVTSRPSRQPRGPPSLGSGAHSAEDSGGSPATATTGVTSTHAVLNIPEKPVRRRPSEEFINYSLKCSVWDCCVLVGSPLLGRAEAALITLCGVTNIVAQVAFAVTIHLHLVDGIFADANARHLFSELLEWRILHGHSVDYADAVSQEPLVARVCLGTAFTLGAGGLPAVIAENVQRYTNGGFGALMGSGEAVCLLILLLWLLTICGELASVHSFAAALWSQHSSKEWFLWHGGCAFTESTGGGISMAEVSFPRKVGLLLWVVLPRHAVLIYLGYVGVLLLVGTTSSIGLLLLNLLALQSILQVDRLLFTTIVPTEVSALVARLEPLKIPPTGRHHKCKKCWILLQPTLIVAVLLAVERTLLQDLLKNMEVARHLVCGGDLSFVASLRPDGLVEVSRGGNAGGGAHAPGSYSHLAILQATGLSTVALASEVPGLQDPRLLGPKLAVAPLSIQSAVYDIALVAASVEVCSDVHPGDANFEPSLALLQVELGDDRLTSCAFISPHDDCAGDARPAGLARRWCPEACGCSDATAGLYHAAGCPAACLAVSTLELPGCADAPATDSVAQDGDSTTAGGLQRFLSEVLVSIPDGHEIRRNATRDGCVFAASLQQLGGAPVDLCAGDALLGLRSLRPLCPEACGCKGAPHLPLCPLSCAVTLPPSSGP